MNLDLDKLSGETIEIKLESAHGFWDIDYVGITDEWSDSINLVKLRNTRSLNQDGLDVLPKISADDNVYVELPNEGTFVNLFFEAPSNPNSYLILLGNGYYHHKRNYTAKPNYKVLNELKKDKLSTHQLSRLLQSQFAMTLNKASHN